MVRMLPRNPALLALGLVAAGFLPQVGCSDRASPSAADSSCKCDRPGDDQKIEWDASGNDLSGLDQAPSVEAGRPDGARPDHRKPDGAQHKDLSVKPDHSSPDGPGACAKVACEVINDCCECSSYDKTGPTPTPCPITSCFVPTCTSWGVKNPTSYCLQGQCFAAESATTCASDTDCQLINDCCECLALPATLTLPACKKLCVVSTCVAKGLAITSLKARCLSGSCRLSY
jgi:hypothetical protein